MEPETTETQEATVQQKYAVHMLAFTKTTMQTALDAIMEESSSAMIAFDPSMKEKLEKAPTAFRTKTCIEAMQLWVDGAAHTNKVETVLGHFGMSTEDMAKIMDEDFPVK